MARIEFSTKPETYVDTCGRKPIGELIGDEGPSKRGSTYYRSLMICAREHALKYEVELEADGGPNENLVIGLIYHRALEAYYRKIMEYQQALDAKGAARDDFYYFGNTMEAQTAAWEAIGPVSSEPGYELTYETVRRALEGYFERYYNLDRWRIIAVEETIETKTPLEYSARLDAVVECNGRLWVVEHKTAKSVNADGLDHYDMDIQTLGQYWLMTNCIDLSKFLPIAGVIVNITTKHKTPQFFRKEVLPSKQHLAMFEEAIGGWISVRVVMKKLNWPRSLGHCAGIARGYSRCEFFDVCRNFPNATIQQLVSSPPQGFKIDPPEAE